MDIKATIIGSDWFCGDKLFFSKPVKIFVVRFSHCLNELNTGHFNVLMSFTEPPGILEFPETIIRHSSKFGLILSHDPAVLRSCPNARKMLFGSSWISDNDALSIDVAKKEFKISFLCGSKDTLEGHRTRQEVWFHQSRIRTPKVFWISSVAPIPSVDNNPMYPKDTSKILLFRDAQFHIAVENSIVPDYFTEKICDCFRTKTVPIYCGCPNIGEYFDIEGIITFRSEKDLIEICNNLTPEDYYKRMDALNRNFDQVQQYLGCIEKMVSVIKSVI